MIPIGMAVSFKAILREGGEAVLLCLTAGEQGEPAAHCIHKDGLGEVEPWQELDLSEAHVLWWCSPKAHCVHSRLCIVGRLRRLLQSCLVSRHCCALNGKAVFLYESNSTNHFHTGTISIV